VYFKQFYLGCLAHASYMIGSGDEAVVVDPQRDVGQYIEEAAANGLRIAHVIETHLHADFVSGHVELANRTGAKIHIGAAADARFDHVAARDGDELTLGDVRLRFLETPGHTPESISVLVYDPATSDEPSMVLTGDTLFIGDVGRPDLTGTRGFTTEQMAGMLYDTLHAKLLPLPDSVEVYPAHGAGSACGKNISKDTHSSLGEQRRTNYALQPMTKDEFVELVTADLAPPPAYFPYDAARNREGARAIEELGLPPALAPERVRELQEAGAAVLDVRTNLEFGAGHVPGSVNIGLGGQFASWVGTLLDPTRDMVLVAASDGEVHEAVIRLARVGFERVVGYLGNGVEAWDTAGLPVASVAQIDVTELHNRLERTDEPLQVIDVRRPGEYAGGHVPGAAHAPLDRLEHALEGLEASRPTAVICAGGYRSSAATSLLEAHGFTELYNVLGGTGAWVRAGFATETA
jgi:glyoxylase-like metal-dependent hydrolase (beta-lactamase superfamily II)/rhodanese-related sulfurtransferase